MSTIRDVAKLADVSISTVSHVLNGTRQVSEDKRARVLLATQQLNYQRNSLASSLRRQRTQTLGIIVPNNDNPFFSRLLGEIEAICFEQGYHILIGNANNDPDRELSYLEVMLSRQVDGVILISTGAFERSVNMIAQHGVPTVIVDRSLQLGNVDEILTDNAQGGQIATEYLLSLGHRRIGCIAGPSFLTPSGKRLDGYRHALANANLPIEESLIIHGDFGLESGMQATKALLALPTPPTAIFACNDLMAIGAYHALKEAGLSVPEDMSVIGFDDIASASYVLPTLTTIAQPSTDVCQLAIKRLLERIQTPSALPRHDLLAVTLVQRQSTCPPKSARS